MHPVSTISCVASLLVLCVSCGSKREGSLILGEDDKPHYAGYWKLKLDEHPSPREAIQQADAYFESLPYAQRTPHRDKVRVKFLDGFFSGFVDPKAGLEGTHDEYWHGLEAGKAYRNGNPAKLKDTMEAFGYIATEAEGMWICRFETSLFSPLGVNSGQRWWLEGLTDTAFEWTKDTTIPEDGVISIRVIGYLSPKGQYGHLGRYDHELYATTISKIKDD